MKRLIMIVVFLGYCSSLLLYASDDVKDLRIQADKLFCSCMYLEAINVQESFVFSEKDSIQRVIDLSNLSKYYLHYGNYSKALSVADVALSAADSQIDTLSTNYAYVLHVHAMADLKNAHYEKGLAFENRAILIYEQCKNTQSEKYIESLYNLSELYADTGDDKIAIKYGLIAYELCKQIEIQPWLYSELVNSLAYNSIFDLQENSLDQAIKFINESKIIQSDLQNTSLYAYTKAVESQIYDSIGDRITSIKCAEESINIFERIGYEHHPDYAFALNNCACAYSGFLNGKDIPLFEKVVKIRKQSLGIAHPYYAAALSNLGVTYSNYGYYEKALEVCDQAVSIRRQTLQFEDSYDTSCYAHLATCYYKIKDFNNALRYYSKALVLSQRLFGTKSLDYSKTLLRIADVQIEQKEYSNAESLLLEAMSITDELFGQNSQYYGNCLYYLGKLEYSKGQYQKAISHFDTAVNSCNIGDGDQYYDECLLTKIMAGIKLNFDLQKDITEYDGFLFDRLNQAFIRSTPNERERLWSKYSIWYTSILPSYVKSNLNDENITRLFNSILFSKGLLLNTEIEISGGIIKDDTNKIIFEDLRQTNELLHVTKSLNVSKRQYDIDSLSTRIDYLEHQLINNNSDYNHYLNYQTIDYNDIRKSITHEDVVIEFVKYYDDYNIPYYVALIAKNNFSSPQYIPLFSERELKEAFMDIEHSSEKITDLIWTPISPYITDAKNIYFSADGLLCTIAIESLPHWNRKGFMNNFYQINRLSTTKNIISDKSETKKPNKSNNLAILYGGIKYNEQPNTHHNFDINRGGSLQYSYLPATKTEVEEVSLILDGEGYAVKTLTGNDATEQSFKLLSGKEIDIIHISTHGFNFSDNISDDKWRGFLLGYKRESSEEIAMSQTGLLFANANAYFKSDSGTISSDKDGIITAEEISHLNLSSVNLVVLSACQTGEGLLSDNGVYGLQRGLKKAGVQHILMTLEEVDDNATAILMTKFYSELKNHTPSKALSNAQKYLRNYKGSILIDGKKYKVRYHEAKYWAPFILLS